MRWFLFDVSVVDADKYLILSLFTQVDRLFVRSNQRWMAQRATKRRRAAVRVAVAYVAIRIVACRPISSMRVQRLAAANHKFH